MALDSSIEVNKGTRVSIENKNFIVFREHSPGKFHGYVVEPANFNSGLSQGTKNALLKKGLIKNIRNGRINK